MRLTSFFSHRYRGERVLTILELLKILNAPGWWLAVNPDGVFRLKHPYFVCADALEMTGDDFISAMANEKMYVSGGSAGGGRSYRSSKLASMQIFKAD